MRIRTLALLVVALGPPAAHAAPALAAAPRLAVRIAGVGQDGGVRVRVSSSRRARVRLSLAARPSGGTARLSGVARNRVLTFAHPSARTVQLTLTAAGRRRLAGCGGAQLVATARARGLGYATATRAVAGPPTCATALAAAGRVPFGTPLHAGQSTFWPGPTIDGDAVDASLCDVSVPCPAFGLSLAEPADRLRVALDTPSREDSFDLQLIDPHGAVAATASLSNQFDNETLVAKPAAGTWTIRVVPRGATAASFRLRAKAERVTTPPRTHTPLLPNLRANPPQELGFVAPANPANAAYPPDTVNPPLDVAGEHPLSCTADEMAPVEAGGGGAHRCLRLTSGPQNVGAGPFDMRFKFVADTLADPNVAIVNGPIFQAVHFADGKVELRPAGTYSFHKTHAHFHDDHILSYDLFHADADGRVGARAGAGTKSGFCPADQLFGDWEAFDQDPAGYFGEGDSVSGGNCYSPTDGFIGLTRGWGDVYRWQRPGQYVEFGDNGDGFYVLRSTVDIENQILETRDDDNTSYAWILVTGEHITTLERGRGSGPDDAHKVVYRGRGPASETL